MKEKEDLQKKLDDDKKLHKLSAEDKKNINDTIIALDKARDVELSKLAVKQDKKEKDEDILEVVKKILIDIKTLID